MAKNVIYKDDVTGLCGMAQLVPYPSITSDDNSTTIDVTVDPASGKSTYDITGLTTRIDDTPSSPVAATGSCSLTIVDSDGNDLFTTVNRNERQCGRSRFGLTEVNLNDADMSGFPVGVTTQLAFDRFSYTNPSTCRSAIVTLNARYGGNPTANIAPGNYFIIRAEASNLTGATGGGGLSPGVTYDTRNNTQVENFQNGVISDTFTFFVSPGATFTFDFELLIEIFNPFIVAPAAVQIPYQSKTRRVDVTWQLQ